MPKGQPNKRYTPEFKLHVVRTMQEESLSYKEAARRFEIGDDKRVAAWGASISVRARKDYQSSGADVVVRIGQRSCQRR